MIALLAGMIVLWIGTVFFGIRAINSTYQTAMKHLYEQQQLAHAERLANIQERDALLERIQRPEYRPTTQQSEQVDVLSTADLPEVDMALVGTVVSEAPSGE